MKKHICFFIVIAFLSSCVLVNNHPGRLYKTALQCAPYDAGIVPGVPWNQPGWDSTMKARVTWAVHLYKKGIVKNLIFSGGAVYSPFYEGKIMCLYAQKLGVPQQNCFAEIEAEHSVENVYYSYRMADSLNFKKLALVTDPFQTALLKGLLKKFNPKIVRIPFIMDTLKNISAQVSIDPNHAVCNAFTKPLPERVSTMERFQGTRGKKVKKWMREDKKRAAKKG